MCTCMTTCIVENRARFNPVGVSLSTTIPNKAATLKFYFNLQVVKSRPSSPRTETSSSLSRCQMFIETYFFVTDAPSTWYLNEVARLVKLTLVLRGRFLEFPFNIKLERK
jgi:hypothetical protein